MDDCLRGLQLLLREGVEVHRWCTGFQAHVRVDGRTVLDDADGIDGMGRSVSADSLFPIYCAGKPLTAAVIGSLVTRNELDFDDVLGDVIERQMSTALRRLSVRDVLSHRAGLWRYPAAAFLALAPKRREQVVLAIEPDDRVDETGRYAEFVGWELLRYIVEDLTENDLEAEFRAAIAVPFGLLDDVCFRMKPGTAHHERLRINVDLQTARPIPMLWERAPHNLDDLRCAGGAMASMRGLASFYEGLLGCTAGPRAPIHHSVVTEMVRPATPRAPDPVLGRPCRHGLGFMVELADHCFGDRFSDRSFGHSGLNGMTFAGADPALGLVFAIHLNGVTAHDGGRDPSRSPQARRQLIDDLVLREVAGVRSA